MASRAFGARDQRRSAGEKRLEQALEPNEDRIYAYRAGTSSSPSGPQALGLPASPEKRQSAVTAFGRSTQAKSGSVQPDDDSELAVSTSGRERLYEAYNDLHALAQAFSKDFDAPAILVTGHQTDGKSGEAPLMCRQLISQLHMIASCNNQQRQGAKHVLQAMVLSALRHMLAPHSFMHGHACQLELKCMCEQHLCMQR